MDIIDRLLESSFIKSDEAASYFIHGYNADDLKALQKADKIFKEGLRYPQGCRNIASTMACLNNNTKEELHNDITNYVSRGNYRIIVKTHKQLNNIYLGKCGKVKGNAGNQDKRICFLDYFLDSKVVPRELIADVAFFKNTNGRLGLSFSSKI